MILTRVLIEQAALKQLEKVPTFIKVKLYQWIERVEEFGIAEIRKSKGLHDEPLKGLRTGQRSIRLNRSYRAIYLQKQNGDLCLIQIIEVTNHEY